MGALSNIPALNIILFPETETETGNGACPIGPYTTRMSPRSLQPIFTLYYFESCSIFSHSNSHRYRSAAISQCTNKGKGYKATNGVEITHARSNVPTWHIRRSVAMGAKVILKGHHADERLSQLICRICPPTSA